MAEHLFVRRICIGQLRFHAVRQIEERKASGVTRCLRKLLVERVTEDVVIMGTRQPREVAPRSRKGYQMLGPNSAANDGVVKFCVRSRVGAAVCAVWEGEVM